MSLSHLLFLHGWGDTLNPKILSLFQWVGCSCFNVERWIGPNSHLPHHVNHLHKKKLKTTIKSKISRTTITNSQIYYPTRRSQSYRYILKKNQPSTIARPQHNLESKQKIQPRVVVSIFANPRPHDGPWVSPSHASRIKSGKMRRREEKRMIKADFERDERRWENERGRVRERREKD